MTTKVTVPGRKSLRTTSEIAKAVKQYYGDVKAAKEKGIPVIWSFGLIPREIFHAVDAPVIYLEHLPGVLAMKQLSSHYMQIAEEAGVSRDVCAVHRCFIGAAVAEERDGYLDKFFVPPDFIIASNHPCMSESKSFLFAADRYGCPYYFIDAPINTWEKEIPDYAIEYYGGQLREALDFMSEHGFKVDLDKLKETVRLSMKLFELWNKIDQLRMAVPTPMSSVDGVTAAYPLIHMCGTQLGVTLYEKLLEEVKEKVGRGEGVVDDEKLRLMWFGVPPIFNMGLLNYVEEKYGAVILKSLPEYVPGGVYDLSIMDPDKPFESLAYKALVDVINPTKQNMVDFIIKDIKDFQIDGLIGTVKRSCGLVPGYMRLLKDSIYEECEVPTTIFDLDGMDIRDYDDATTKANLDSFIEALLARKRR